MNELETRLAEDRAEAIRWAKEVLEDERAAILGSETTGLRPPVDFVEIGVVDRRGRQLFHSFVRPHLPITKEAEAVRGYTAEDLNLMPTFDDLAGVLYKLLRWRRAVVYNASYDRVVYDGLAEAHGYDPLPPWECAMEHYSAFRGEWSEYHESHTRQRLPGGDHPAIGDARAALAVVREMARAE